MLAGAWPFFCFRSVDVDGSVVKGFHHRNETRRCGASCPISAIMEAIGDQENESNTEKQVTTMIVKKCGNHTCGIGRRVFGLAQTAVGAGAMAIGVPMLILPGPGLLVLGGGAFVTAGGIKKVLGK